MAWHNTLNNTAINIIKVIMRKNFLVLFVALVALMPLKASAYYHGGYGYHGGGYCCGPRIGIGLNFYEPIYAPAYPPVYGGYAYPAPYYAPPPTVVYANPAPVYAVPSQAYADPAPVASNQQCREYRGPIVVGGKTRQGYGTACLQPDGSWRMSQ